MDENGYNFYRYKAMKNGEAPSKQGYKIWMSTRYSFYRVSNANSFRDKNVIGVSYKIYRLRQDHL